jgi:phosphoglucosamine mutase
MTQRLFGTDGIRGTSNSDPMTADIALKVGMAAGCHFRRGSHQHRVLIGKDTRLSGYMLEAALTAGFISVGMDVIIVGPMPTPAVRSGGDADRLAQPVRRQRHQVVRP